MNIVEQDISRFGDDIEDFTGDLSYQRSTAKCIEEIGGAAKRLTSDVTSRYRDIDWSAVCGMRDVLVHLYDRIDLMVQWDTMTNDLPILKEYCLRVIADLESKSDVQERLRLFSGIMRTPSLMSLRVRAPSTRNAL